MNVKLPSPVSTTALNRYYFLAHGHIVEHKAGAVKAVYEELIGSLSYVQALKVFPQRYR
jgi:hypothetical protein